MGINRVLLTQIIQSSQNHLAAMKFILVLFSVLRLYECYLAKSPKGGQSLTFKAIDCTNPTRFRATSFSRVCAHDGLSRTETQDAILLQRISEHKIRAVRCERRLSVIHSYCAIWSHSKLMKAMDMELLEPFEAHECKNTLEKMLYVTRKQRVIPVELNKEIQFQETLTGYLSMTPNDIHCQGATRIIDGQPHQNVLSLGTYTVILREVELEYDSQKRTLNDLESHTTIDVTCVDRRYCTDNNMGYVVRNDGHFCPYVLLRAGAMEIVELVTTKGERTKGILARKHKALFRLGKEISAVNPCIDHGVVHATNHPNVLVLYPTELEIVMQDLVLASGEAVDLELEISTSEAFLEYRFQESVSKYLANSLGSLCKLGLYNTPSLVPSPLHADRYIQISGEVISELQCAQVVATVILGEKPVNWCTRDLLPVRYNKKRMFLQANSRMLTREVPKFTKNCTTLSRPLFISDTGVIVTANPVIRQAHIELDTQGLNMFDSWLKNASLQEDNFGESLLYDRDAMSELNHVLHYGLTKSKVVSALTHAYCADGQCGSFQPPDSSGFNVNKLIAHAEGEFNLGQKIYRTLEQAGSFTSIFVAIYLGCQLIVMFSRKFLPGLQLTPPSWMTSMWRSNQPPPAPQTWESTEMHNLLTDTLVDKTRNRLANMTQFSTILPSEASRTSTSTLSTKIVPSTKPVASTTSDVHKPTAPKVDNTSSSANRTASTNIFQHL